MSASPYPVNSRAVGVAAVLVLLASALAASAALTGGASRADAAPKAQPPNIVVITTDDQTLASYRPDTMPNVTRQIAGKGTTFTNAIVTTPLCCPSRATWLTGQYAHNHGVTSNRLGYVALREKINTLPAWLHRAGYRTVHVGKYLNGYEAVAQARTGAPTEVAPAPSASPRVEGPLAESVSPLPVSTSPASDSPRAAVSR